MVQVPSDDGPEEGGGGGPAANVNEAVYEHFQSASFSGSAGGILKTNAVPAGEQNTIKYLNPNGSASWSNGFTNPDPDRPAVVKVEIKLPALSISPPVDATVFSFSRTALVTVAGDVMDVFAVSGRNIMQDTSKGAFYIPGGTLVFNKALAGGQSISIVTTDDADFDWADAGGTLDLTIYPQNDRVHGYVTGRVAP